jgi:hypothetical protein
MEAEWRLVEDCQRLLRSIVPTEWKIERGGGERKLGGSFADAVVHVEAPRGLRGALVVEAKSTLEPRDVASVAARLQSAVELLDPAAARVVFAPWLSARTRSLLEAAGVGYVDLTGNVQLSLNEPGLVLVLSGAQHDPNPARRNSLSLRGDGAGRVVRFLVDVAPPYTATEVAQFSGVSVPYASRLLIKLDREALVERGDRGLVVGVDWAGLLRLRAQSYEVFGSNEVHGFISGLGAREVVRRLHADPTPVYLALTGSFAAAQRAPIAATNQLTVYVDNPAATADALGLLPTDEGADVVLLIPYDFVAVDRCELQDGVWVAAASQVVLDCLTGSGRMPAEGEALLEWMASDEHRWRRQNTEDLKLRGQVFR